jgi:hypothetical protein
MTAQSEDPGICLDRLFAQKSTFWPICPDDFPPNFAIFVWMGPSLPEFLPDMSGLDEQPLVRDFGFSSA